MSTSTCNISESLIDRHFSGLYISLQTNSKPSYRDTYELLGFEDQVQDEFYGLLVHVRRTSDQKHFCLTLSDLKATDENWKHEQILDDYSVWFVNWR